MPIWICPVFDKYRISHWPFPPKAWFLDLNEIERKKTEAEKLSNYLSEAAEDFFSLVLL